MAQRKPHNHRCAARYSVFKRRTISLDVDLEEEIEDWRAKQRPIPNFSEAIVALTRRGLGGGKA